MAPMLTIQETAKRLGLSVDTVRRLVQDGRLRACRLTRRLLISEAELERVVRQATEPVRVA